MRESRGSERGREEEEKTSKREEDGGNNLIATPEGTRRETKRMEATLTRISTKPRSSFVQCDSYHMYALLG